MVSAIYSSYGGDTPVTTATLLDEISMTRPLSVVMDTQIQQLRQWAESRTVAVD